MKTFRKLFSGILVAVFLFALAPAAFAMDWDIANGDITVCASSGGQTVTQGAGAAVEDSAPVIKGSAENKTITLEANWDSAGVNVTFSGLSVTNGNQSAVVVGGDGDVTIQATGRNTLSSDGVRPTVEKTPNGSLTVTGDAKSSLTIENSSSNTAFGGDVSAVTFGGGKVNISDISSEDDVDLTVSGGSVNVGTISAGHGNAGVAGYPGSDGFEGMVGEPGGDGGDGGDGSNVDILVSGGSFKADSILGGVGGVGGAGGPGGNGSLGGSGGKGGKGGKGGSVTVTGTGGSISIKHMAGGSMGSAGASGAPGADGATGGQGSAALSAPILGAPLAPSAPVLMNNLLALSAPLTASGKSTATLVLKPVGGSYVYRVVPVNAGVDDIPQYIADTLADGEEIILSDITEASAQFTVPTMESADDNTYEACFTVSAPCTFELEESTLQITPRGEKESFSAAVSVNSLVRLQHMGIESIKITIDGAETSISITDLLAALADGDTIEFCMENGKLVLYVRSASGDRKDLQSLLG